jgi:hypothetical protein
MKITEEEKESWIINVDMHFEQTQRLDNNLKRRQDEMNIMVVKSYKDWSQSLYEINYWWENEIFEITTAKSWENSSKITKKDKIEWIFLEPINNRIKQTKITKRNESIEMIELAEQKERKSEDPNQILDQIT